MSTPSWSGYQQGVGPGWYPDPSGDYEQRWWDGTRWTDDVVTGPFRGSVPLPAPGEPLLPGVETLVWQNEWGTLTSHRLWVVEHRGQQATEFALWMVRGAQVRSAVGGLADIGVTIAYPGYGGRATWVLRAVADAPAVAAALLRQANRVRRSLGG